MLESAQQQAANVLILEEQIKNLEAEVSAQHKVLRYIYFLLLSNFNILLLFDISC